MAKITKTATICDKCKNETIVPHEVFGYDDEAFDLCEICYNERFCDKCGDEHNTLHYVESTDEYWCEDCCNDRIGELESEIYKLRNVEDCYTIEDYRDIH